MRVWFYAGLSRPFSPRTLDRQGLGGSETALYYVARELARLGHDVTVLNHCGPESGTYDRVHYRDLEADRATWRDMAVRRPPDVLVLFRRMMDVTVRIPARLRVFWAHDFQGVSDTYPPSPVLRRLAVGWRRWTGPLFHRRVDAVFTVSRFLADQFVWLYRTPPEKLVVMPNGIDPALFDGCGREIRLPHRLVYTSVPERGLEQLVREIFPAIRQAIPTAELHVFSYQPVGARVGPGVDGVRLHGSVPKSRLARELCRSSLLVYPSNFDELGAIAVLEAMAAGTPPVTSTRGVLPELAGDGTRGIAVAGRPGTTEFAAAFVKATLDLLGDEPRLEAMRDRAREYVMAHHRWDVIARRWEQELQARLRQA